MRRIAIVTFGCQMNKLDSELAAEALSDAGHAIVNSEHDADTVIFNTCSVRGHAEERVLSRLAQLAPRRAADSSFRLGIMGCFAERDGANLLSRLPHLDFAAGTRQFPRLPEILARLDAAPGKTGLFGPAPEGAADSPGIGPAHRRARHKGLHGFVAVMRGCGNRCAYCIVPDVRGGEVSRPADAIVAEVASLARAGAREVTLLGQNIDAYGKRDGSSLAALLGRIEREVPAGTGLARLRFVTSHPRDISRELVRAVADSSRVCAHFHMPAQSGSDAVLAAMRRGYSRGEYDDKLGLIREIIPDAGIASDFIVGFPGESEADYLATRELVEAANFDNAFIFKYSPRPGTPAAAMPDDVPAHEKKRRNNDLLAMQNAVSLARRQRMAGRRVRVMAEGPSARDTARWTGRTAENHICVFPATGGVAPGDVVDLIVEGASALTLYCRLAGDEAASSGDGE